MVLQEDGDRQGDNLVLYGASEVFIELEGEEGNQLGIPVINISILTEMIE